MLISTSKRFIFIANMKTASTAIETRLRWTAEIALVEERFGKHQSFRELTTRFDWLFDTIGLDQFFKFGVIRDPIEYMVSLYNAHMNPRLQDNPRLFTGGLDFDDFLSDWVPRNLGQMTQQHLRFRDEEGLIAANYLISYDKLASGLRFVEECVGIEDLTSLGKENVSYGSFELFSLGSAHRAWIEARFEGDRDVLDNHCDRILTPWSQCESAKPYRPFGDNLSSSGWSRQTAGEGEFAASQEDLIRALYRILLFREPDTPGLASHSSRMRGGEPIEDLLRIFLKSQEFVDKKVAFLQTYLPDVTLAISDGKIEMEYVTHQCGQHAITFALGRYSKDTYVETLRHGSIDQAFAPFVLRRAQQKGGRFKVADFGANVGAVSLLLAANGIDVLAIEALPANFIALATSARVNGMQNLLPVNIAAMDGPGLVTLCGTSAWATAGIAGGGATVPCDTLVNILRTYDFSDPDIIKIDIEGAELPSLTGAEEFFAERPDTEVIFESNNHTCHFFGYDRVDLLRWFEERGFSNYAFCPGGLMPVSVDDPQPDPVVDILATKRSPRELQQQGEVIVPMTDDYVLEALLKISVSEHPHIRRHFITEIARVRDSVRKLPLWRQIEKRALMIGMPAG